MSLTSRPCSGVLDTDTMCKKSWGLFLSQERLDEFHRPWTERKFCSDAVNHGFPDRDLLWSGAGGRDDNAATFGYVPVGLDIQDGHVADTAAAGQGFLPE